eukprot:tig00000197_g15684.t1
MSPQRIREIVSRYQPPKPRNPEDTERTSSRSHGEMKKDVGTVRDGRAGQWTGTEAMPPPSRGGTWHGRKEFIKREDRSRLDELVGMRGAPTPVPEEIIAGIQRRNARRLQESEDGASRGAGLDSRSPSPPPDAYSPSLSPSPPPGYEVPWEVPSRLGGSRSMGSLPRPSSSGGLPGMASSRRLGELARPRTPPMFHVGPTPFPSDVEIKLGRTGNRLPTAPSPYLSAPSPYPSAPSPYPSAPSPYPSSPSPVPSLSASLSASSLHSKTSPLRPSRYHTAPYSYMVTHNQCLGVDRYLGAYRVTGPRQQLRKTPMIF